MDGNSRAIISDFVTQGTDGALSAAKAEEIADMWNIEEGQITRYDLRNTAYNASLLTDETHIYRIGNLAILSMYVRMPAVVPSGGTGIYTYRLPWAPPVVFYDQRSVGATPSRTYTYINPDGNVEVRQYEATVNAGIIIMFPIANVIADESGGE